MQITFDPTNLIDREAVAIMIESLNRQPTNTGSVKDEPKAPVAEPKPAAKKAAAAKPTPEPVIEDEPVEADDDDLFETPEPLTREDIQAKASALVAEGKRAVVKTALTAVDAARFSDVTDENLAKFAKLLDA